MFSFINELDKHIYFTYIFIIVINENKFFQNNNFIKFVEKCNDRLVSSSLLR